MKAPKALWYKGQAAEKAQIKNRNGIERALTWISGKNTNKVKFLLSASPNKVGNLKGTSQQDSITKITRFKQGIYCC